MHTQGRRKVWKSRGSISPPDFGSSVNPILTKGSRLYPLQYYSVPSPPRIFRHSYGPVFIGYTYKLGWAIFGTTRKNFSLRQSEYFPKAFTTIIIKKKNRSGISISIHLLCLEKKNKMIKQWVYPSFIFSWSISHIVEHEFFWWGSLASSGQ